MKIFICLFLLTGCGCRIGSEIRTHGYHGAFGVAYLDSQEEVKRDKG